MTEQETQSTRTTHGTDSTDSTSDRIIEIRDARVSFEMERGVSRVLDDVDLDVQRGEILGVVGESGSGKSMLASAMLDAVVDPGVLSGDITYYPDDGDPVGVLGLSDRQLKRLRWEQISMVFQGAMSSFNPTMGVREHFVETLEAHDDDVEAGMERARELLSDLYLEPERILDSYPHELSGGMQQRALIALSLVLEPDVLVMDEPTAALDLLMQRSILSLLENLREKYDLTMVFITHDLPLVAELADRIAVMYAFELIEMGPTDEILRHAAHPYTRALLNATPNLDAPLEEMQSIEGAAPDPVDVPQGCTYGPRCPLADETCVADEPAFTRAGPDHDVACFHWEDAAEAVPFTGERLDEDPGASITEERR
ncbi:ABC transporter ATP-binding protein [Natrinema salaciae]|uniref:Peptide/nickel transport system ATP-binding protein n=1 Tax=Natrinema salaciae TaxID=1186196 RepID=A0A1H9JXJ4_9EURY|nr:peptide/nickel transport system ATP-binding protein [Natrinema salaciae]